LDKLAVLKVNGGLGTSMGESNHVMGDVLLIVIIIRYDRG